MLIEPELIEPISHQGLLKDFGTFIVEYREKLSSIFGERAEATEYTERGWPTSILDDIQSSRPLSVFIPKEHGGRGGRVLECLSMLEESSYQSLPLSLTYGINGALFLQPLSRYGTDSVKEHVFADFMENGSLGGLMITEPDYGSDALSMKTSYTESESDYHITGTKHWAGLTGLADYWLVTARRQEESGLGRDIDFFVSKTADAAQRIEVVERYPSLGLYMIPYGRNAVDIRVPKENKLSPSSTGIRMMLDTLHRSRSQFPGMAMGFLRRMFDDALDHCRERYVGGQSLFGYDQVKNRLSVLQAYSTTCSAMCAFTSENAGIDKDLATDSVTSNSIKAVVTDLMQQASQSLMQLTGSKGYRLDSRAGRATLDSRPFQIFEGANDILYQQITESVVKSMRRLKEKNLYQFLSNYDLTNRASTYFKSVLSVDLDHTLSQRKLVDMGKILGRIISMEFVIEIGERGFRPDLISNCLAVLKEDVESIVTRFVGDSTATVSEDNVAGASWQEFVVAG